MSNRRMKNEQGTINRNEITSMSGSRQVRGRIFSALDRVLDKPSKLTSYVKGSLAGFFANQRRSTPKFTFETLEPRVLFAATALVPDEFVIVENAGGAGASAVLLGDGTTAGVAATVTTTDGGTTDTISSIAIDVSAAAGTSFTIQLAFSGISGQSPTITVVGLEDGDEIDLQVFNEALDDGVGGGAYESPTGATSGFTAATEVVDADNGGVTAAGIADGTTLTAAGNIGTTTISDGELNGGTVLINNTVTNTTVGLVTIADGVDLTGGNDLDITIQAGIDADSASVSGLTIVGPVTLGDNSLNVVVEADGGTGTIDIADGETIAIDGTGDLTVGSGTNAPVGNVALGAVTLSDDGGISVTSQANANIGNVSIDSLTFTNAASGTADVAIVPHGDGDLGNTTLGPVSIGTGGDTDITIGAAGNDNVGSVTIGAITNANTSGAGIAVAGEEIGNINFGTITNQGAGAQNGSYTVTASTGNVGTVTLGNITLGDAADGSSSSVTIGAAAGNVGNVSMNDVTLAAGTSGSVTVGAEDLGNVSAGSVWTINGSGSISFTATAGDIGTFGGTNLDVNFGAATTGSLVASATGGIGAALFNSVDYLGTVGTFTVNADSDADGTGSLASFTIEGAGDDVTNNLSLGASTTISGASIGDINVAESVANGATFTAAGVGDADSIGNVVIGRVFGSGTAVDTANVFFDGSLAAEDGITSLTVQGRVGVNAAASIAANTDTAGEDDNAGAGFLSVGSLGPVTVVGVAGAVSFTAGTITAADFDTFDLTNGHWATSLTTNITDVEDRVAKTSDVTYVAVRNGAINSGSFTLDDGISGSATVTGTTAGIVAKALTPTNGNITLGTVTLDADGALTGATRAGGLASGIAASGSITITTLDSDAANEAVGSTTDVAANDIGAITAATGIAIGTLDAGGDVGDITNVETVATAGSRTVSITTLNVNGNINNIASTGDSAGDSVTIGSGFVAGDIDTVNAGLGTLSIAGGLRVLTGVTGSAVGVFTGSFGGATAIDSIIAVEGTFTGGSLDYTVTFPGGASDGSVTINDIVGTTSQNDSELIFATRTAGVSYLAADDTGREFDVAAISDLNANQHDWNLIRIEGDVTGDFGADSNNFDGTNAGENSLGDITNLEIQGTWSNGGTNAGSTFYLNSLDEISYGSVTAPVTADIADNSDGSIQDLEIYTTLGAITGENILVTIPDGGSITKQFVGPTGAFETITLTDTDSDGIINNVVISFNGGLITDLYLFGENIGIEYQALDAHNAATNSDTDIHYGIGTTVGGQAVDATEPSAAGQLAISFLEFSSAIGDIDLVDIAPTNGIGIGAGPVLVGYIVTVDSSSDFSGSVGDYIGDNNDGTGSSGSMVVTGTPTVFAGIGNITADGPLGAILTSGGVGTITTTDTTGAAAPSAHLAGLVTDGSAGAITIDGNVTTSLVVGDVVVLDNGDDDTLGTADDVIGINGTPGFLGDIDVAGSIGSSDGRVTSIGTDPASPDNIDGDSLINGQRPSISGDEISAPDGISVNITAGEELNAAIVSGKRAAVADSAGNFADAGGDITGNITASEIFGDIWAGGSIGTDGGGQQIVATGLGSVNAGGPDSGNIGDGDFPNRALQITATGGSAGNIYTNILSAGDMVNLQVIAGSGTGGSILGNIVAGTDGSGSIVSTNVNSSTLSSQLLADNNVGNANNTNVVSAADDISLNRVHSGRQTYDDSVSPAVSVTGPGSVNSDFLAGTVGGSPVVGNVNSDNLPIFDFAVDGVNQNDDITITVLQAGQMQGNLDNDVNGTLVASSDITIGTLNVDGDAIGNDGVAGGHIAAAGMGAKHSDGDLNINSGTVQGVLFGTFSAGMFVPFDNSNASPLNPADSGPLQAGTVLVQGDAYVQLNVGQWNQSATGVNGNDGITLEELLAGTESGANSSFAPTFSIGATVDVEAQINVVGLPGDANVNPDPASGNAVDVSIAAFANVDGDIEVANTADFNLVMANIDAVTAIGGNGNPSSPSPLLSLNDGDDGHLYLNITSNGAAEGGLDVEYFLAGFDYFTRTATGAVAPTASNAPAGSVATAVRTPSFWESFGTGDIDGNLTALDGNNTDGWENGDLSFALIAAGNDINGDLYADDDIIARFGSFDTDGADLFRGGVDADIVAGASGNSSISPFGDGLFDGGNLNGNIIAGDDILKQATIIPGTPDTIVETVVTDSVSQNLAFASASGTLVFDQFDASTISNPDGGVIALDGVAITANGTVTEATATFTNITAGAVDATAATQVSLSLTSSFFNPSPVVVASVGGPIVQSIPAGGTDVEVTVPGNTQAFPVSPAAPLSQFAGAGTFDVEYLVTASGTALIDGVGNSASITNPGGTGDVTVTYTYSITTTEIIPGTPDQVIGDQIVNIAAIGSEESGNGNVDGDIRSGVRQQLNGPDLFGNDDDEQGDIFAFVVAGDSVNGDIDAGDVNSRGRNAAGNFTGGVWAGAGVDLDIFTTADNSTDGSINGHIDVAGTLDVRNANDLEFGIYAEDDIHSIFVGWNNNGGDLLGNVVAEGDIEEIEVWGNVGASGEDSVIFAGGNISELVVGDPSGYIGSLRPESLYTSTFGDLFADVYAGGQDSDDDDTHIHLGGNIQSGSTVILGANVGVEEARIEQAGREVSYEFGEGLGVFIFNGSDLGNSGPDIYAYGGDDDAVELTVDGDGAAASIGNLVVVADLDFLHVTKGTVGSITVNDDYDVKADIDAAVAPLNLGQFPFLTSSLLSVRDIEYYAGDDKEAVDLDTVNVDGNIGDIDVQGSVTGSITSEHGSIGNIVTGGQIADADITAYVNIGNIYVGTGSYGGGFGNGTITAQTGSMGVLSVEDNIDLSDNEQTETASNGDFSLPRTINVSQNVGGLIARGGGIGNFSGGGNALDGSAIQATGLHVNGSIGLIQAADNVTGIFTAVNGSIGLDLDPTDQFGLVNDAGISSQTGDILVTLVAGQDIGNVAAHVGSILQQTLPPQAQDWTAGNSIGDVTAGQNITVSMLAERGSIGSLTSVAGSVAASALANTGIGNVTAGVDVLGSYTAINGSVGNVVAQAGNVGSGSVASASQTFLVLSVENLNNPGDGFRVPGNQTGVFAPGTTFTVSGSSSGFNGTYTVSSTQVISGETRVTTTSNFTGSSFSTDGTITVSSLTGVASGINVLAGDSVGDITATLGAVGGNYHALNDIGNVRASLSVSGTYTAEEGSVGNLTSLAADVNAEVVARTGIGNIEAGRSVFGDYTVTAGPIGSISALTGNIGSSSDRLDVRANGGVELDLDRLEYVHVVNGTMLNGVGSVISYLGNIYANITTGASVGVVNGAGDDVTGGIAAPIGSVELGLHVGGHIGGISGGNGVTIDSDSVVLGSIGIIRGVGGAGGGFSTTVGGVSANNPLIIVANGIDYRVEVASGTASVSYTVSGSSVVFDEIIYTPGATSGLEVLTLDNQGNDVSVQTHVESLTVNGDLQSLRIDGSLGDAFVTGDIVAGADIVIESGEFGSLEAGGTNFGLQTIVLNKDNQTFSYSNSLSGSSSVVTVYIGKGDATLVVNNGLVESIELGNKARDFAIVVSDAAVNPNTKGAIEAAFNSGAGRVHVDELLAESNANLRGIMVEGDLDRLFIGGSKGQLRDVQVKGDLGTLFAAKQIRGVHVYGDAGVVDGGTQLRDVQIDGSVDVLKATKTVQNVTTGGNAGIVSAGGTLKSVFIGGSSISVGAGKVQDLQIVGSVGLGFDSDLNHTLGTAFSIDDAARILGVAGSSSTQSLSNLWEVGDNGPTSGSSFLGGLQAETLKNTVVGGLLSDFVVFKKADGFDSLFNSTVDDANVVGTFGRGDDNEILRGTFIKVDGQIVSFPDLF